MNRGTDEEDGKLFSLQLSGVQQRLTPKKAISRKRRHELISHGGCDDSVGETNWQGGAPTLHELDAVVLKELEDERDYDKGKNMVAETPPMFMWPKAAVDELQNNIGVLAQSIEKRIVRHSNPEVHRSLRQNEAAMASTRGAASLSLYTTEKADPDYASNPLAWCDKPKYRSGVVVDHRHDKETSVVLEMREALELPLTTPLPAEVLADEMFTLGAMPRDCVKALQSLNTHAQLERFSRTERRKAHKRQAQTLREVLAGVENSCRMALFCVRLLYDARVEVCYFMESLANYFGVLSFELDIGVPADRAREALSQLRAQIVAEVRHRREEAEKRMREPNVSEDPLPTSLYTDDGEEQRKLWLKDAMAFSDLADLFHLDYEEEAKQKDSTPAVREIATFCPLAVFAPDKSTTLMRLPCIFSYHYYATCQCLIPKSEPESDDAKKAIAPREQNESQRMIDKTRVRSSVPFNFQQKRPR